MTATPWGVEPKPLPVVKPPAPHEACGSCSGTGGVPVEWQAEARCLIYDECPTCHGDGLTVEARRVRKEYVDEQNRNYWS